MINKNDGGVQYANAIENSGVTLQGREVKKPFADRIPVLALKHSDQYLCQAARKFKDLRDAYRLVYEEYLARGYCERRPSRMHYTYFCALPSSRTFLLQKKGQQEVLGTASLILNSPCGLPTKSLFAEIIRELQEKGRRIAEVSLLAISTRAFGKTIFSLTNVQKLIATFQLFKAIFRYAQSKGVTDLIIAVNPKHEKLYRYLTFERIAPVRPYPSVCDNPALLMRLDIIWFMDARFRDQIVQKYFLHKSAEDVESGSFPIAREVLDQLFFEAEPPLPADEFSIFQAYLKSCYRDLTSHERNL